MTDQSLFTDNQENPQVTPEQQSNPSSPENPFADQLGSIRNEKGEPKYSDINTALEALKHSQEYIPKLSQEKQQLEEQLNELRAKLEASEKISDVLSQTTPKEEGTPATPNLGEVDIEKLLEEKLAAREAASAAQSNASRVNQELMTRFGANAQAEVQKVASELGLSASELGEMAQSKPDVVLRLFGTGGNVKPTASGARLPQHTTDANEIKPPEKSLLRGASGQEQAAYMAKIRESIYNQHGITG
tara:strand:+ start:22673 stop:23410 length:738 start_codon:yes stop_codon:yes gene_type:complete